MTWARKEAYTKAIGRGLALPLNQIQISLSPEPQDTPVIATLPGFEQGTIFDLPHENKNIVCSLCIIYN